MFRRRKKFRGNLPQDLYDTPGELIVGDQGRGLYFLSEDRLTLVAMTGPDFNAMTENQLRYWFLMELRKIAETIKT